MADNSNNKVKRGTGNLALTAGGQPEQPTLEDILGASVKKIIDSIEKDRDVMKDVLDNVVSIKDKFSNQAIDDIKNILDDKMTAMLCALYGTSDANKNTSTPTWLSKLGKQDPKKSIWTGLLQPINSIESSIRDLTDELAESFAQSPQTVQTIVDIQPVVSSLKSIENILKQVGGNNEVPTTETVVNSNPIVTNPIVNVELQPVIDTLHSIEEIVRTINSSINIVPTVENTIEVPTTETVVNSNPIVTNPVVNIELQPVLDALNSIETIVNDIVKSFTTAPLEEAIFESAFSKSETALAIVSSLQSIEEIVRAMNTDDKEHVIKSEVIVDTTHIEKIIKDGFTQLKPSDESVLDQKAILDILKTINDSVSVIKEQQKKDKPIEHNVNINANGLDSAIKDAIRAIDSQIDFATLLSIGSQSAISGGAFDMLFQMIKKLEAVANESTYIPFYVNVINDSLESFTKLDVTSINDIKEFSNDIAKLNVILGFIAATYSTSVLGYTALHGEVKAISQLVTAINSLPDVKDINILDSVEELTKKMAVISGGLSLIGIISPTAIIGAYAMLLELTVINSVVEKLDTINEADTSNLDSVEELTKKMTVISGSLSLIGIISPTAIIGAYAMLLELTVINSVVEKLDTINEADTSNLDSIEELVKKMAVISGGLSIITALAPFAIIGAYAMLLEVKVISSIVSGIASAKVDDEAFENLKDFAILMVACSGVALLAAAVGTYVLMNLPGIIGFTVVLSAFIFATVGAFNLASRGMKTALQGAQDFGELVAISAAVMLFGGGIVTFFPEIVLGALSFAVTMAAFMYATILPYKQLPTIIGKKDDVVLTTANNFALLVAMSASTLLLGGGLFTLFPGLAVGVVVFEVLLAGFIRGVTKVYAANIKEIGTAIQSADAFSKLIAISAASILAGGLLFYLNPWLALTVTIFGFILTVFVGTITSVYTEHAKEIKNAIPTAIALSTLIAVSSAALLIGGILFATKEGMFIASLGFAFVTVVFIGAFAGIIKWLGDMSLENLAAGIAAILAITVIIDMFTNTFTKIANISDSINPDKMWETLKMMGITVGATTLLVGILAGIIKSSATSGFLLTGGAIAAAELALVGIVEIISLTAGAMKDVAEASNAWASMKVPDTKNVIDSIGAFMTIAAAMAPLASPTMLIEMMAAKTNVDAMSSVISSCGTSVSEFASLTVPIFDKNGKKVGVRKMNYNDFSDAANNVQAIIETLGNAIIQTYNENPQIFSAGWLGDFLGMNTPFAIVAKSCAAMGSMISDIADGVRDYANLRMPLYDKNGKVIGSRPFDKADFKSAADNIAEVIMTLGNAIIATYELGKPLGMFDDTRKWWMPGISTPFTMVVRSTSTLGKLISDIAAGVKDYAALRIPIFDANGKEIGTRQMTPQDFADAANSIRDVIITLGSAIIAVYNSDPKMFEQAGEASMLKQLVGTDLGDNPFVIVRKSFEGTGKLISEAVQAIIDASKIDVDIDAAGKKVAEVLLAIVSAVKATYDKGDGIFDKSSSILSKVTGNDFGDNPFVIVKKSLEGTSKLIQEAVTFVKEAAKIEVDDIPTAETKITGAISAMASAVKAAYDLNPDMYKQSSSIISDIFGTDMGDNPFVIVKKSLMGTSELISDAAKAIQEVQKIRFDGNIGDKVKFILGVIPKNITGIIPEDEDALDSLSEYQEVIKKLMNVYKSVWDVMAGMNGAENAITSMDTVGEGINSMIFWIKSSINEIPDGLEMLVKIQGFAASMQLYNEAITDLAQAFSLAPEDFTQYDNLQKALSRINIEIQNVPELTRFREESEILKDYVRTVNSLNISKVNSLANLADSLTEMSTKLGSLEDLTDVLSNKVATVLTSLADRMDEASRTIKTADRMQQDRHKKIEDAMSRLKSLLQQPLSINVKHIPEQEQNPNNPVSTDTNATQQNNGGTSGGNGGGGTINNGAIAGDSGSAAKTGQDNDQGKEEKKTLPDYLLSGNNDSSRIEQLIQWNSMQNNNKTGGGKQEGAKW